MIAPLLAYPRLSTAAKVLKPLDVEIQYQLAADIWHAIRHQKAPKWCAANMWRNYEGALLFWWGCLAAQMPGGAMDCPKYREAWAKAYRRGEMAVGPLPWWLGNEGFHLRCQSLLMQREPTYGGIFVYAPLEAAWWWPLQEENTWQIV